MLNAKKLLGKILTCPLVVESGTSGAWTYRKWSDGVAECWTNVSKQVAANTIDTTTYVDYPFEFAEYPVATIGLLAGGSDIYRAHIISRTTTQIRFCLINKHTATVGLGLGVYVKGRCK